jgi:uncharacterized protein (DUF1778 family)
VLESKYTVTVNLREPPKNGGAQIVFRCTKQDRDLINRAAKLLGISTNQLMRASVIQLAKMILLENLPDITKRKKVDVDEHLTRLTIDNLPPGLIKK